MPQESCVYRRPGLYYSAVRADLFEFCQDNRLASEILNFFIYRTDQVLGVQQGRGDGGPPYLECSKDHIRDHTISAGSIDSITVALKHLQAIGAITIHPPRFIGGSSQYLLNIDFLNEELPKMTRKFGNEPKRVPGRKNDTSFSRMGNFPHEDFEAPVWETSHTPHGKVPTQAVWETSQSPYGKLPTVYKEDQFSNSITETVPETATQNILLSRDLRSGTTNLEESSTLESFSGAELTDLPTLPLSPSLPPAFLPTNDSVGYLGKNLEIKDRAEEPIDPDAFLGAYRRRAKGAKKLQGPDKAYAMERLGELDIYHEELIACLDGFLESSWGKENKYPIRSLLKDPMRWYKDPESVASVAQDEPQALPRPVATPESRTAPSSPSWDLCAAWNERVKVAPQADPSIRKTKEYLEALIDPELKSRISDLVDKSDLLYGSGSKYITLPWLLKRKEGNPLNWRRALSGEYDFNIKQQPGGQSSLQRTIEQGREEFMAQFR